LTAKSNETTLSFGDVFELRVSGGGGYGDPLERDPELVLRDLALGYVSADTARAAHGVVITEAGVDRKATEQLRRAIRLGRSAWTPLGSTDDDEPASPATGEPPRELQEYIEARDDGVHRTLACKLCGHALGDYKGSYKRHLLLNEGPVSTIPTAPDPTFMLDEPMLLRRYCCPGCQVLIRTEVVRSGEPTLSDMRLGSGELRFGDAITGGGLSA
jgi:N-methylhydantoinase B